MGRWPWNWCCTLPLTLLFSFFFGSTLLELINEGTKWNGINRMVTNIIYASGFMIIIAYYHQFIVSSMLVLVMIKGIPLLRTSIAARSLQGMHLWYIKPVARLTTKSTLMDTFPAVVIPTMIPYSLNLRVSTPVLVTLDLQWLVANNLLISTLPTASVHHHCHFCSLYSTWSKDFLYCRNGCFSTDLMLVQGRV